MMNNLTEAIKVGDRVECGKTGEQGTVIGIDYSSDDPLYKVRFDNGEVEKKDRYDLFKLGGVSSKSKESKDRNETLLATLVESLKGKSVYKTLKALSEGKVEDDAVALKGLFSLGTHVAIEVEHGRKEYRTLLPSIVEKIEQLIRRYR